MGKIIRINYSRKHHVLTVIFIILAAILVLSSLICIMILLKHNTAKKIPSSDIYSLEYNVARGGDSNRAISELSSTADRQTDKKTRDLYLSAALNQAMNVGKYSIALSYAKTLEADEQTINTAVDLAECYEKTSDYKNAYKYYGIAASRDRNNIGHDRGEYQYCIDSQKRVKEYIK